MSEFKPILVIYLPSNAPMEKLLETKKVLLKNPDIRKYPILVILTEGESRVEIISVDKATVVEDIEKYIELNFNLDSKTF